MTTSTASDQNLLEKIGIALVGVRVIGSGIDEEEARDEDYDGDAFGNVTGLTMRIYGDQSMNPVLTFEDGEFESDYAMLTKGDDPELIKIALNDDLGDEDWENVHEQEDYLYLSQVLASMTYGNAPYSKGDHNLTALLTELGVTSFNNLDLAPDEDNDANRYADTKLTDMFNEEAAKRGIDPQQYIGFSYTID